MLFSERLKLLRKKSGLTQNDLAKYLYVTDKTVSSWEQGRTEPGLELMLKIADKLDCTVSYLLYGDNEKSDVETELKIRLTDDEYNKLLSHMDNNALFIRETHQVDTYYQPTYRKFLDKNPVNEWLRIGRRGSKIILNYKNWYDNMYCDEYEVEIDDYVNLDKIFNVLGIEVIAEVDKYRKTFTYLDKYEVALDTVSKLGYFVEIEVKKYSKKPLEEYDALLKVAKDLGLNLDNIDKEGYPYHIIYG